MSLISRIGATLVKRMGVRAFRSSVGGGDKVGPGLCRGRNYTTEQYNMYKTLEVTEPSQYVFKVQLNRPDKSNAMNRDFWTEIQECFTDLTVNEECRVVILTGAGRNFSAGLDVVDFAQDFFSSTSSDEGMDVARRAMKLKRLIKSMQNSFTSLEKCPKPVIAVVQGACVGGGVDMISACDVRYCTSDAFFQIKEVDLALMADVGTIQRLPKLVGNDSLLRELIFTARKFTVDEARSMGMVSNVYGSQEKAEQAAMDLADVIASKSPIAVQSSKVNLNYSRDHPVDDALDYAALWNSAMIQTEDILKAVQAGMNKEKPIFAKL